MTTPTPPLSDTNANSLRKIAGKLLVLLAVIAIVMVGYRWLGGAAFLSRMGEHESRLREYHAGHPGITIGLAFVLYATVTGFSIPGALLLSVAYAWFFRFWTALPLVSFASTTGATISFLISRYLFRDAFQSRFEKRLRTVNQSFEKEGAYYLFSLRLIPAMPFFVINVVMGLTSIKTATYWWVSQIGMLPGTIVILLAGDALADSVPSLSELAKRDLSDIFTPRIIAALILLAVFPYAVRAIMRRR